MAGIERTITGSLNLSDKYELSAENDLLEINDANITLVVPADIFTNEGDDTATIRNSKISGEEGTSFFLGSGNDSLTIDGSTLDIDVLAGSGDDIVTVAGMLALSRTLSLGSGNDLLEITGTISETGNIDFGAGNDTLKLDGGTLKNTGTISAITDLETTVSGGTIHQSLSFKGETNTLTLAGSLTGDNNDRTLTFSDSAVTVSVNGTVNTNVGWQLTNATLTQAPGVTGASMSFSNCSERAIWAEKSQLFLQEIIFKSNLAGTRYLQGGAVFLNFGASANFTNASFSGNAAKAYVPNTVFGVARGGAVYLNSEASANFTNAAFSGNGAFAVYTAQGGAVCLNSGASANFTNASFSGNWASASFVCTAQGGAICLNSNASANFTNASFSGNVARAKIAQAGAVYLNSDASANFTNASFYGNAAASGGAVYLNSGASANFTNASFSDNTANDYGGALDLNSGASANFTNAAFSGNVARGGYTAQGGAICLNSSASANFTNASFSGNVASAYVSGTVCDSAQGGAICLNSGAFANFTNASFSGNVASASGFGWSGVITAQGGAVCLNSGASANFTKASFFGNVAYAHITCNNQKYGAAYAQGGAVYLDCGASANFTNASFVGNVVNACIQYFSDYSSALAYGGAVYLNSGASVNFTDASFNANRASSGGALFAQSANILYSVQEEDIQNVGNIANKGGFLYAENCSVIFNIANNRTLNIGAIGQNSDDIAGSGTITKNGVGVMTIHSDIAGYSGQWTVAQGELQLLSRSRTISSDQWTVSEDALLLLSEYADAVTLTGGWKLGGTIDFGGGEDALATAGYTLEGGKLYVQNLTISGEGTVQSQLLLRDVESSFILKLAGVTLDGNLNGGNASDTITVTAESTINGTMDLGLGYNRVVINSAATLNGEVLLTAGGTTEIEVFRNASLTENVLTARFDSSSELTQIDFNWSSIPDLDKVRILISDDPTFRTYEFAIGLYNQSKSFTIYTEGTNFLQFQVQDEDGWKQQLLPDEGNPDQVTGLTVAYTDGQVLLSWNTTHDNLGGNGVKQYRVQFASEESFGTVLVEELVTSTEFLVESLAQGEYFVRVRAEDYTGNAGEWSSSQSFDFDNTPPEKPVATADISQPTNQIVTVSAVFSMDSVLRQYSLDNGQNWLDYTGGIEFTANGTVLFRAFDDHNNVSEIANYEVTNIDKIAPEAPTASASNTTPTNKNVTVTAVFSGDTATKQYSTDNQTWKTYTQGITLSANGTVYFRAVDAAGNVSEVTTYEVTNIDKIAPEAPTASADVTSQTNQDVTVSAAFSSDSARKQYSLDNQTWKTYTQGITLTANGTVYFRGIDVAGNISEVTSCEVANIDKVAPEKPTAGADITALTNQDVTVTAAFSEDTATKQYSTDGMTWKSYTKGIVLSKNGAVYFRGIDAAGNVSEATSYQVSNIDKTAPDAPTASASNTKPTNKNVTVTATFSEDSTTKQYSTDGETWKTYTKGISLSANGTAYFRGIDAAGNVSEVTMYEVTNIDKTAPDAVSGLSATQEGNTIAFSWRATTDNLSGVAKYEVQVADASDFGHVVASQSGVDLTRFSAHFTASGTYHYRVRATDAVGNVSEWAAASVEFDFTDATPPTVPTNLQVVQDGANVTFSWNASTDAESGVAGYELRLVRNGRTETVVQVAGTSATLELAESDYAWSVTAKDSFGNASAAADGEAFRMLLPVGEPKQYNLADSGAAKLVKGAKGDDLFPLVPDDVWGTCHVAQWNGDEEDTVDLADFNRFHDAVLGNGGYDVLQLPSGDNGLLFNDTLSPAASDADTEARLAGISEIVGNSGRDVIDLTDENGGYASDVLLKGGDGDDVLWAGKGNDILIGGAGDDDLRGGQGDDIYLFGENWGRDTLRDDGGTLVFDNALAGKLAFSATPDGTRITDGVNAVELTWNATADAVMFADVASLTEMRRDTIKGFLA